MENKVYFHNEYSVDFKTIIDLHLCNWKPNLALHLSLLTEFINGPANMIHDLWHKILLYLAEYSACFEVIAGLNKGQEYFIQT